MNDALHSPEASGQRPAGGRADAGVATDRIRVTLVKSVASCKQGHRATVRGLGLKWTNHSVDLEDTPAVRGMINKVSYLLQVAKPAGAK